MLRWDDLRRKISHRTVDLRSMPGADGHLLAVLLDLKGPTPLADQIIHAGHQAANTPIPGVIGPRLVEVTDRRITILLDPVSSRALRLDTLLGALKFRNERIGEPLAASVIITVLGLLEQIHDAPGFDGEPRVHGELHKGVVLLAPGGSVALLGPGLAPVNAVLLPPLSREVDRFRILSPEAARGEPLDRRADVYAAGVLYYELVTGRPYLDHLTASLVCQRAIEGQPPELPEALHRKRPGLYEVFQRALAPHRDERYSSAAALSDAIYDELESTGRSLGSATELARLIETAVPDQVGKGPIVLLRSEHEPDAFNGLLANFSDKPAPPQKSDDEPPNLGAAPAPKFGDWGAVLEHEVTGINKVPEIAAAAAAEFQREASSPTEPIEPAKKRNPISVSSLPLPKPASGPTAPTAPILGADTPFADLDAPDAATDRTAPAAHNVIIEDSSGIVRWVMAIAALAVVGLIGVFALSGSSEAENSTVTAAPPPDAGVATQPDAAIIAAPPPPPAPPAYSAGRRMVQPPPSPNTAKNNLGYLTVMSSPSGAAVELDGGYIGQTPLVLRHDFEQRYYRLRVLAEGHRPWEREVRPEGDLKSISVVATLAPK